MEAGEAGREGKGWAGDLVVSENPELCDIKGICVFMFLTNMRQDHAQPPGAYLICAILFSFFRFATRRDDFFSLRLFRSLKKSFPRFHVLKAKNGFAVLKRSV